MRCHSAYPFASFSCGHKVPLAWPEREHERLWSGSQVGSGVVFVVAIKNLMASNRF